LAGQRIEIKEVDDGIGPSHMFAIEQTARASTLIFGSELPLVARALPEVAVERTECV
jgi:hypothetical protein